MRKEIMDEMVRLKAQLVDNHEPCEGHGWLMPLEDGTNNPCECMTVFHYLNALIETKISHDYWWLDIEDLEMGQKYITLCNWFVKRLDKAVKHALGLMFLGANGIGKTSMQCAIGKYAVVAGYNVQYFTAQQYIESRKMEDDTLTKEYESGQIILLDELDKVYIKSRSNYVTKTLEDFMRRKTSAGAVFIICTNHDAKTLEDVFGQSTMSMLQRHLRFVDVTGDDYSLKLQTRWDSLMEEDRDYYDTHIMSMAKLLMEHDLKEGLV